MLKLKAADSFDFVFSIAFSRYWTRNNLSCMHQGFRGFATKAIPPSKLALQNVVMCLGLPDWMKRLQELRIWNGRVGNEMVAQALDQLNDARMAMKFFKWAGKQPAYKQNVQTYNALFKAFFRAGDHEKAVRMFPRISPDCGPYVLEKKKKKRIALEFVYANVESYSIMICGLCNVGEIDEAVRFYNHMVNKARVPNSDICTCLILSLCKVGRVEEAYLCFRSMNRYCSVDISTHNTLIEELFRVNKVKRAQLVIDRMFKRGPFPDSLTYNLVVRGLSKTGGMDEAFDLFDKMIKCGKGPDLSTYTALFSGLCRENKMDKALQVLETMPASECPSIRDTYNFLNAEFRNMGSTSLRSSVCQF